VKTYSPGGTKHIAAYDAPFNCLSLHYAAYHLQLPKIDHLWNKLSFVLVTFKVKVKNTFL